MRFILQKRVHVLITTVAFVIYLLSSCSTIVDSYPIHNTTKPEAVSTRDDTTKVLDSASTTTIFTDSVGRQVKVPIQINRVVPSGPISQVVLYTAVSDLLVGLAVPFTSEAERFLPIEVYQLPVFGQFFGRNAGINMEALMAATPDLVIDIGEKRSGITADLDQLQEQIGIPVVFIESTRANLGSKANVYARLAELFPSHKTQLLNLNQQTQEIYNTVKGLVAGISQAERYTVYYATGDTGLHTIAAGILHSQIFDTLGLHNVVEGIEGSNQVGGTVVNMEQLFLWDPDVIVVETSSAYEIITTDVSWASLSAVQNGRVYLIPSIPYNFLGSPPSVNQLIGMLWLGNIVYPEVFQLDMEQKVIEFYREFYQIILSNEQVQEILMSK